MERKKKLNRSDSTLSRFMMKSMTASFPLRLCDSS